MTCFTPMLMSKRTWDRLSSTQRQAIEEAGAASDSYFEGAQIELDRQALIGFEKGGAEVRSLTGEEFCRLA